MVGLAGLGVVVVLAIAGLAVRYRRRGVGLLGPLFWHEAILLVRRPRHILIRAAYPTVLLALLGWFFLEHIRTSSGHSAWVRLTQPVVPVTTMADFAQDFFLLFIVVQFLFLAVVTARVSAAALTEDKERQRLDFLLSTPLENHEIILGKLAARLATVVLLALAAVPLLSLLPLLGGVEPLLMAAVVLFTLLTMIGLAALGVACSVYHRTTSEAVGALFGFVFLYHVFSGGVMVALGGPWDLGAQLLTPSWAGGLTFEDVALTINAGNVVVQVIAVLQALDAGKRLGDVLPDVLLRYAVFQTLVVFFSCRLAVVRLRSACRAQQEPRTDPASVVPKKRGQFVEVQRPPIDDRPLLWKSIYVEDPGRPRPGQRVLINIRLPEPLESRVRATVVVLSLLTPVGLALVIAYFGHDSFVIVLNGLFRILATLLGSIALVRIAAHASATMAGERERGTLDALRLTPLEPGEILWEKMLGALWLARGMMGWVLAFGVLTMVLGGLHPLGLLLYVVAWLAYAAVLVNLAMWFSVISPTRRVAGWRTSLTIFAVMVGAIVLSPSLFDPGDVGQGMTLSLIAPFVLAASAMRGQDLAELWDFAHEGRLALGATIGLACLLLMSAYLWQRTRARFAAETASPGKGL